MSIQFELLLDEEEDECLECGAKLFVGDYLTLDGCCYCDAGLDLLTPWGVT